MNKEQLLENVRTVHRLAGDTITRLEAELAEAEKPELRHGDYGHDEGSGDGFIVIEQSGLFGSPKGFYANQNGQVLINESTVARVRTGNIFDDLKAIAEPLEGYIFYLGPVKVAMFGGYIHLGRHGAGYPVEVDVCYLAEFILNLRRMQATQQGGRND